MIEIRRFQELSNTELFRILQLRSRVFVVEQNCVFCDMDQADEKAIHLFIKNNDRVIGCARIIAAENLPAVSIGRLAVDADFRRTGTGRLLMKTAIEHCFTHFKRADITIEAQCYLTKFYERLGFVATSNPYLEDGIPHVSMKLNR